MRSGKMRKTLLSVGLAALCLFSACGGQTAAGSSQEEIP